MLSEFDSAPAAPAAPLAPVRPDAEVDCALVRDQIV